MFSPRVGKTAKTVGRFHLTKGRYSRSRSNLEVRLTRTADEECQAHHASKAAASCQALGCLQAVHGGPRGDKHRARRFGMCGARFPLVILIQKSLGTVPH